MAATLHPRRRLYSVLGTVGLIYGRALWTRGSRFRYRSREAYREARRRDARRGGRRLYRRILRLQGLFIKVGQFLSLRVDLFPREFAEELARLQDQVPPAPYEAIRERIVQELGAPPEEIFASFEKAPLAAASLGQVHEARLRSGERVVVKVQYPGIEDLVQVDLRILRRVLRLMRRLQPDLDYETVLSEFGKHVRMELDYANELANAERIRAELADRDDIVIPRFFPDLSTGKVVTLAFVEGIKVTDAERLVAAGYDLGDITHRVIDCYARQILRHGFFHADPHPGNIFVLPGGRIALVDFGLAWELQPAVLAGLAKMAMSLIQQDARLMAEAMSEVGFATVSGAGPDAMRRIAESVLRGATAIAVRGRAEMDFSALAEDFMAAIGENPVVHMPLDFVMLGRVLGLLTGLGRALRQKKVRVDKIVFPYLMERFAPPA